MRVKEPVSSSILQRPRPFLYTVKAGQIPGKRSIGNMLLLKLGETSRNVGCLDPSSFVSTVWQRPVSLGNNRGWCKLGDCLSAKAGNRKLQWSFATYETLP